MLKIADMDFWSRISGIYQRDRITNECGRNNGMHSWFGMNIYNKWPIIMYTQSNPKLATQGQIKECHRISSLIYVTKHVIGKCWDFPGIQTTIAKILYHLLVILEYCSSAWSHRYAIHINNIENALQRNNWNQCPH